MKYVFIPHSDSGHGTGEVFRAKIVAEHIRNLNPDIEISFLINSESAFTEEIIGFRTFFYSRISRNDNKEAVGEYGSGSLMHPLDRKILEAFDQTVRTADTVILDSSYLPLLVEFKKRGLATVFFSIRNKSRSKAFKLETLRHLDLHITIAPRAFRPSIRDWLFLKLTKTKLLRIDTIYSEPHDKVTEAVLRKYKIETGEDFLLIAPGGGMFKIDGKYIIDILVRIGESLSNKLGIKIVLAQGIGESSTFSTSRKLFLAGLLDNSELIALMRASKLCICGAGGIAYQLMSCGVPGILIKLGGSDQSERINELQSFLPSSNLNEDSILKEVNRLLSSATLYNDARDKIKRSGYKNGLLEVVSKILELNPGKHRRP